MNSPAADGLPLGRPRRRRNWSPARVSPRNFCSAITFNSTVRHLRIRWSKCDRLSAISTLPIVVKAGRSCGGQGRGHRQEQGRRRPGGCGRGAEREDAGRSRGASRAGRECLKGDELSFLVNFSDGERVVPLGGGCKITNAWATGIPVRTPAAWARTRPADIVDDQMRDWLVTSHRAAGGRRA